MSATGLLTPRQYQIMKLVSIGLEDKEIAARLGISQGTVGNHLTMAYQRLGANNRAHAAVIYTVLALTSAGAAI